MTWAAGSTLNPRTYLVRLTAVDRTGNRIVYGAPNAFVGRYPRGVVVRIQGVDAGFCEAQLPARATSPRSTSRRTRHRSRCACSIPAPSRWSPTPTTSSPVSRSTAGPTSIDWTAWRSKPHTIAFHVPDLPSGLYYVQFTAADGRVGYAPFVVRPVVLGQTSRVLVVLPTNTWQAYNFQDVNGDGYGDTWYAGPPNRTVDLGRTYIARGVPPRFYRYDLPFLHWLYWSGKQAEFISDSDFDHIVDGDQLAASYDLIVFEGHEEYVLPHEYDVVQRFRDLGGNLMFLSANNFFWKVQKSRNTLLKIGRWRDAGRPEAALIGVEYRANDDGQHQGLFTVQNSAAVAVALGRHRADRRLDVRPVRRRVRDRDRRLAPQSPPGTIVVAQIPDLLGPGLTAQMSYYETPAGAKVFAAGTLDFGGSATFWPVKQHARQRLGPARQPALTISPGPTRSEGSQSPQSKSRERDQRLSSDGWSGRGASAAASWVASRSGDDGPGSSMNVSSVVGQSSEVSSASIPVTPSIVSSIRACSSVLKSGWFSNGSSDMYFSSGISCSSAALRRFNSRWSWITCANIDGASTAMKSSCSDAMSFRRGSLDDLRGSRFRRHDDPVPARALRLVERRIGGREQFARARGTGVGGNPETRGDRHLLPVRHEHPACLGRRPGALSETRTADGAGAREHERELLAAPATRDVALAHRLSQRGGECLQDLVAGGVPVPVVHLLEEVEVCEHDAHRRRRSVTRGRARTSTSPRACGDSQGR